MSMNLKPAIRYQLREYLVSCLVFWAINALLIGIGFCRNGAGQNGTDQRFA